MEIDEMGRRQHILRALCLRHKTLSRQEVKRATRNINHSVVQFTKINASMYLSDRFNTWVRVAWLSGLFASLALPPT